MQPADILTDLRATFPDLDILSTPDTHYVFYGPTRDEPPESRQPFVTVVTSDAHDRASDLARPGVFRVNVGISRESYRARFGPEPAWNREGDGTVDTGHDYAALDALMPHPVYSPMGWVCVLNPSAATWDRMRPLVVEAHELAARAHARRRDAGARP